MKINKVNRVLKALLALLLLFSYYSSPNAKNISTGTININSANFEQLQLIPGIGQSSAKKIIVYRKKNKKFKRTDELLINNLVNKKYINSVLEKVTLSGNHNYTNPNHKKTNYFNKQYYKKDFSINLEKVYENSKVTLLTDRSYFKSIVLSIKSAKQSIWLSTFTFKITSHTSNAAQKIVNLLIQQRKKGITVNVLLEKSNYHKQLSQENQRIASIFRKNNINVFYDSPKNTLHNKIIIIDEHLVYIGSHNMTHSALTRNHEVSVAIESEPLAKEVINYLKTIYQEQ